MPSAHLVSESFVLTPEGWLPLHGSSLPQEVYGIDRHGRLATAQVTCRRMNGATQGAFIATEAAYGCFASESRLIESEGRSLALKKVIEANLIADFSLEAVREHPPVFAVGKIAVDAIWSALERSAAYKESGMCALRCRGRRVYTSSQSVGPGLVVRKCGNSSFCVVNRSEFESGMSNDWVEAIMLLAKNWLRNDEDHFELETRDYAIGIWLLSAMRCSEMPHRVISETRQHTSLVCLERLTSGTNTVVSRGRCAFVTVGPSDQIKLSWESTSWNPVANGFVLAANSS